MKYKKVPHTVHRKVFIAKKDGKVFEAFDKQSLKHKIRKWVSKSQVDLKTLGNEKGKLYSFDISEETRSYTMTKKVRKAA